ncbi:hypothetical protein EYF80_002118 [Liparis tanakae]|uniref:Uncharacterized protein n=1 Tax=Liparis tanakae TaxID=230148 RepID=A0A4Z2JCN0_9TELE|nr:hypothetical protein EYF80_002118 [Liparis tanakae]
MVDVSHQVNHATEGSREPGLAGSRCHAIKRNSFGQKEATSLQRLHHKACVSIVGSFFRYDLLITSINTRLQCEQGPHHAGPRVLVEVSDQNDARFLASTQLHAHIQNTLNQRRKARATSESFFISPPVGMHLKEKAGEVVFQWCEQMTDDGNAPGPAQEPLSGTATHVGHISVVDREAKDPAGNREMSLLSLTPMATTFSNIQKNGLSSPSLGLASLSRR